MAASDQVAAPAERACADATEAALLHGREGETLRAVVVDHAEKGMDVQLVDVPVLARVSPATGRLLGCARSQVRLESADVAAGKVVLTRA